MLIGVVSDTHDSLDSVRASIDLFQRERVDLVIHLGDYVAPFTLKLFAEAFREKFQGILGNNDGERTGLMLTAGMFNSGLHDQFYEISLGGGRALLVHGFGPADITRKIVKALALSGYWRAVLYGHTHEPHVEFVRGSLVLNPGDGGGLINKPTVALLDPESMEARIVEL